MHNPPIVGAHVSAAGGVDLAPKRAASIDAATAQVFSANQRQWSPKEPSDEQIEEWWRECQRTGLSMPIVHASYLINLSAVEEQKMDRSRSAFVDELRRSQRLGMHGVVLHPGSHMGVGEEAGLRAVAESLDAVFESVGDDSGPWIPNAEGITEGDDPSGPVMVLLENTAGQGTNLGWRFDHLEMIRSHVTAANRDRIGVCLDTCHAFAAGYDLTSGPGWHDTWRTIEDSVGIDAIRAVHLNDSKQPLGSRRDRHASLGEGEMGEAPFRALATDPRFASIPMVLETPSGMDGWAREIASMRRWATEEPPFAS